MSDSGIIAVMTTNEGEYSQRPWCSFANNIGFKFVNNNKKAKYLTVHRSQMAVSKINAVLDALMRAYDHHGCRQFVRELIHNGDDILLHAVPRCVVDMHSDNSAVLLQRLLFSQASSPWVTKTE